VPPKLVVALGQKFLKPALRIKNLLDGRSLLSSINLEWENLKRITLKAAKETVGKI
jgi:hypothetical protein